MRKPSISIRCVTGFGPHDTQSRASGYTPAARSLGLALNSREVPDATDARIRNPEDLDGAFEAARQQHPDALVSVEDPFTATYRKRITDFAIAARLRYGL